MGGCCYGGNQSSSQKSNYKGTIDFTPFIERQNNDVSFLFKPHGEETNSERAQILKELHDSESRYIKGLKSIRNRYINPLECKIYQTKKKSPAWRQSRHPLLNIRWL